MDFIRIPKSSCSNLYILLNKNSRSWQTIIIELTDRTQIKISDHIYCDLDEKKFIYDSWIKEWTKEFDMSSKDYKTLIKMIFKKLQFIPGRR